MTLAVDGKLAKYRERGATRAMLGLSDIDGVLLGKFVSLENLQSLLNKGGGFCDCVFGWDVDDQLPDRHRPAPGGRARYVPEFLAMPAPTETI